MNKVQLNSQELGFCLLASNQSAHNTSWATATIQAIENGAK